MGRSFGKSVRPFEACFAAALSDVTAFKKGRKSLKQGGNFLRVEHSGPDHKRRWATGNERRVVLYPRFDVVFNRATADKICRGLKERWPLDERLRVRGDIMEGIHSHA